MPGSSSTSFIPKRNPDRKDRQSVKRKVFFGSFIIRIIFFAVLLSAAGVYFYKDKLNSDLEAEVVSFNAAIGKFNVKEMERVLATDLRLTQANDRLAHSASIVSLLNSFEESAIGSSQVKKFLLTRTDDVTFEVEAEIKTDNFDSVLFQRSAFDTNSTLVVTQIDDLVLSNVLPQDPLYQSETVSEEGVMSLSFKAVMSVNPDNIHHLPRPVTQNFAPIITEPTVVTPPVESGSSSVTEEQAVNENVI